MVEFFEVGVLGNKKLSPFVHHISLEKPKGFVFQPGQFVMVKTSVGLRPYSIASSPDSSNLEFCVKSAGKVSGAFCSLLEGEKVEISSARGDFTFKSEGAKRVIFVATGTGLAPFKSMVPFVLKKFPEKKVILIFGTKKEEDILYRDYFEGLSRSDSFEYIVVLSREPNWGGEKGHVDSVLRRLLSEKQGETEIYLCGLNAMVEDSVKVAESENFEKDKIHFEKYG